MVSGHHVPLTTLLLNIDFRFRGHVMTEKEIFFEVIDKVTPEERASYLQAACGQDVLLRRRVEDLLAKHFQPESFMQGPAVHDASTAAFVPPTEGPGTIIDRYKLLEKLGEGGFGAVYVA